MPEVLTVYQLGERLRIPPDWIREQARAGNLPHLRAGRRLLFNPDAVVAALARMAATIPDRKAVADAR